jgi:hypothetical protein
MLFAGEGDEIFELADEHVWCRKALALAPGR